MKVAILSNNYSNNDLPTEHGLSIYVEFNGKKILVDTGLSGMFMNNAQRLGIDLSEVDYVFLTHRHFDHVDGMQYLHFNGQRVFVHKNLFNNEYYKLTANGYEFYGVKWNKDNLKGNYTFIYNDTFVQIDKGIYLSGSIPRPHGTLKSLFYEKVNDTLIPDIIDDEQVMIFEQDDGVIVIAGCTHFGIQNLTSLIKDKFPDKKVKALFAGLHINMPCGANESEVISHIAESCLYEKVYALHCTGERAGKMIEEKLSGKHAFVGEVFDF